jgi:hypothetical protein
MIGATKNLILGRRQLYCLALNGVDQYAPRANPVGLDLNGPELLPNPTFDAGVTGYSAINGGVLSAEGVVKRTGAGSAKVVCNGTAYGGLGTAAINDTSTNKFTYEAWVRCPAANVSKLVRIALTDQTGDVNIGSVQTTVTADTWTKMVVNAQAPGTQTGFKVNATMPANANGDILYVDDASLTQAWDGMGVLAYKTSTNAATAFILGAFSTTASTPNLRFLQSTSNLFRVSIADPVTAVDNATGGNALNDGQWHILIATFQRTGNLTKYVDATATGSSAITAVGKITFNEATLGALYNGTNPTTGQEGHFQWIRFAGLPSNIAGIIAQMNANWRRNGLPRAYPGGTMGLDVDWRSGGLDRSGNGNHLSLTGGPQIQRLR